MRRFTALGLCLVAALVIGALAAGSASALEYKTCIKATSGGEFSDKGCTAAAPGGKYKLGAWNEGKKKTFKVKSSSPKNYLVNPVEESNTELNPTKAPKGAVGEFTASGSKAAGELVGPKESTFIEKFKGVKSGVKNCNSPGEGKGKITTKLLATTLVPIAGGSGQGEEVFSAAEPGKGLLAEYECEGIEIKVSGAIVVEIAGASAAAVKTFHVNAASRENNPNNLQTYLKPGGNGTAAEEEAATDAIEVGACIKVNGPGSEGACFVKYAAGDPEAEAFVFAGGPVTLISTVLKFAPTPVELPAAQNTSAEVKGEAVKIQ